MARRSRPEAPPIGGDTTGLLQSRFGRRLLGLFVVCALGPTSVVAVLSFQSVTSQLTDQSRERLHAIAGSVGRTVYARIAALEHDLRQADLRPSGCRRPTGASAVDDTAETCGAALAIGFRALAAVSESGEHRPMFGVLPNPESFTWLPGGPLEPGRSALVTRRNMQGVPELYVVHRRPGSRPGEVLVGEAYLPALWNEADAQSLPGTVELSVWDQLQGGLIGTGKDTLVVARDVLEQMDRSSTGSFEWTGDSGDHLAAYWTLPQTTRFRIPPLRIVLSEEEDNVIAPMAQFSDTFPLVLLASLGVVVVLGMSQIRRSVLPLAALRQGTSRIAEQQFDSRVAIKSGDELEELGTAFNTMALQLGRQFSALSTAAELDRAVLSSVDTSRIVDTVLDRLPDICDCDALSITLLEPAAPTPGTAAVWVAEPDRPPRRWPTPITLSSADIDATRLNRDRMIIGLSVAATPAYLRCLLSDRPRRAVVFPLFYRDELIGIIALRQEVDGCDEASFVQVRRLADQVAVALSNARMMDQVRFLAFYDSLTRLPNRVLFKERLAHALGRAERGRKLVGVAFLDVDHFSRVNDTLGHEMGDQLVQEVAVRLSACTRRGDSVARYGEEPAVEIARLGGDEFTVMLTDLDDAQDAVRVAQRILESFAKPIRVGGHEIFATVSVGLAIYPFDGTDVDDLLKNADAAMFHAKEQGRNTYRLYSSSLNAEAMARMRMEHQLRKAIEAGEFTIWYQPILDLRTGTVTAAEALVRWQHPELGLLPPGGFITLCEETGLIVPLGRWIVRTVCEQSRAWREDGVGPLTITMNLSGRQLHSEGLVDTVRDALRESAVPPDSLILELTESMLMDPAGQVGVTVRDLSGLGVGLAIDDFGTGYSSLSYLKHFPVGTLKIDRSFVADVTEKDDAAAIVSAIIALARALDMEVVAEGVETKKQAAFLRKLGCQKLQGFLFGRPAPAEEFAAALQRSRSAGGRGLRTGTKGSKVR